MLLPITLLIAVALTPVRAACDSGWSWAPVFFIAKGDLYARGSCSGTPLLSCAFDGAQTIANIGSATVTCSSPSVFTIALQVLGQDAGSASGPAGTCVSAGGLVSAKIDCNAGLLLYVVVGIAVLLLVCCCACCCRCCRGGAQKRSGPTYILLPGNAQPAPPAFYTGKQPTRGTYIAPSQGYA